MAHIGSTNGIIRMRVQRSSFNSAAWAQNTYVELSSSTPSPPSSGFIYLSSEVVNANIVIINLKPISEISFPLYYLPAGSYFFSSNGVSVNVSGSSIPLAENGSIITVIQSSVQDDISPTRHDIYNRNADGSINNSNPFNIFLPNSIFSNINLSWLNSDSRFSTTTYIGSHGFFNPLVVPVTRRHGLLIGASVPSSVRYMSISGSESVRSISTYKTLQQAYSASGLALPSNMPGSVAGEMKIVKFSTDLPVEVPKVTFASNLEVFKKAIELPIYAITYTRKIGVFSSSQYGDSPFVCTENLPINSRLSGINSSTDFINFLYPQERGHAIFAWDGQKSIFLGIVTSNILSTAIEVVNGAWDGIVRGFSSQGLPAISLADSQNLLISFFHGYQIALEENIENFQNVIKNESIWQDSADGGGLSVTDNIGEIGNIISSPIFQNPSIGRKKIIQSLRI